ncbi:MAG: class I SAM-dependent methyltransferase [Lachnospiraceae bacterium]|nr:class I SAM-dependent methyltransferase [Lachnospiraceae bacterium]MDE7434609.1 class I SAM-dependent methyltransferase [Lachnospiraceae bacterium]
MEMIGQVSIDDTYYPGQDLYCDGEVENELLEIVKQYPESAYDEVIYERRKWPVLYHLSHVRENILEWLPITGEQTVLEVGSGCGAVTGALARKAKKVTCIELSRKRSLINAYRHKELGNIEIRLGNFEEVEQHIEEQYDYVTLIGVLEYSGVYLTQESPFVRMLQIVAKHVKPGGKIIVAIENRMGLKYWAGCKEDHVGLYFEGIEGYRNTDTVKTFSRSELAEIIRQAQVGEARWYYPYPDYKFPSVIYSDEYLPKCGELQNNGCNLDTERMLLFNDALAYDELIREGLFPLYSNSFLVEIQKG